MVSSKEKGLVVAACTCFSAHSKSRSRSPNTAQRRSRSPARRTRVESPHVNDDDPAHLTDRERQLALSATDMQIEMTNKAKDEDKEKRVADAKAEFAKLTNTRSGGVYIPPARLRAMQQAAVASGDKSSPEYQRLSWDALRKSITGIVNRVNITNIKQIVPELFSENLIRGRGLFCRSVMKAQAASLPFTPVFAALVAIINTKLPQVGELVVIRLLSQFRRSYKRNDKASRTGSC
jgi:pre-mRNA-splicing factor CWC22